MSRYLVRMPGGSFAEYHAKSRDNALLQAIRDAKHAYGAEWRNAYAERIRVASEEPLHQGARS